MGRAMKFVGGTIALGAGLGGGYYVLTPKPVLSQDDSEVEDVDALIIGGGIMGAVRTEYVLLDAGSCRKICLPLDYA